MIFTCHTGSLGSLVVEVDMKIALKIILTPSSMHRRRSDPRVRFGPRRCEGLSPPCFSLRIGLLCGKDAHIAPHLINNRVIVPDVLYMVGSNGHTMLHNITVLGFAVDAHRQVLDTESSNGCALLSLSVSGEHRDFVYEILP